MLITFLLYDFILPLFKSDSRTYLLDLFIINKVIIMAIDKFNSTFLNSSMVIIIQIYLGCNFIFA